MKYSAANQALASGSRAAGGDRWARAHDNLIEFNRIVDDVLVFSNVCLEPTPVAEPAVLGAWGDEAVPRTMH